MTADLTVHDGCSQPTSEERTHGLNAKNTATTKCPSGTKKLGAQQKRAHRLGRTGCPDPGVEENSITRTLPFRY